ncbi:MAG TPA: alpha/beta hydrolase [Parafilimonas sp.]|nr:alpha/beta hydrolase [Parafilimonas sp.]
MEASFINVSGTKIAYIEKNSAEAKTIFFIHGNSGSSKTWRKQFQDELFKNYRLIAVDLPGHGESSKAANPKYTYSPIITAKILAEALQKLTENKPYFLVGFSYGTNLIAEMLPFINQPLGIVLSGACVVGAGYTADKVIINFESIFLQQTVEKLAAEKFLIEQLYNKNNLTLFVKDYYRTDPFFRTALLENATEGNVSDEIKLLQEYPYELLVITGDDDRLVNNQYIEHTGIRLWNHKAYRIEKAGHFVSNDQPEKFNLLLYDYISERIIEASL